MTPADEMPCRRYVVARVMNDLAPGLPASTLRHKLVQAERMIALLETLLGRAVGRRDAILAQLANE